MRPRRLVISGFTCFRQEVTIDFTPLDLFAITGVTGAGKTSILDAMTYALYGKVFRVEREFRSIMSLGVKEMRVHFEFSVGPAVYRVTRVGFAANRASQVSLERALGNGDWEPLVGKGAREAEAKVTELLGLDFEGFTKAVLLPQNAFFRFLQGDPSERRNILEALLELGIYERIQQRANQVAQDRRREVELLEQQLVREYAGVTADRVEELETAARSAEDRVRGLRAAREAAAEALAIARQVTQARQRVRDLVGQQTDLAAACNELDRQVRAAHETVATLDASLVQLDRELARVAYDDTRHLLLGGIEPQAVRRGEIVKRLADLEGTAVTRATTLETARTQLADRQRDLAGAQSTLAERHEALATAEAQTRTLEARYGTPADIAVARETERQWHDDQAAVAAVAVEIADLEARQVELDARIKHCRTATADADGALALTQTTKTDAEQRASELRDLEVRVAAVQRQFDDTTREVAKAGTALAKKRKDVTAAENAATEARRRAERARETLAVAETALTDLRNENTAYVIRTHLHVGEPCPVCEVPVKQVPTLQTEHSLTEAEEEVGRAKELLRTEEEAAHQAAQTLTRAATELCNIETAAADSESGAERLRQELARLLPSGVSHVDQLAALKKEAEKAVATAERNLAQATDVVTRATKALAGAEGERRGLPDLASKRATHTTIEARCAGAAEAVKRICGIQPSDEAAAALSAIAARLAEAVSAKVWAAEAVPPAGEAVHKLELECERLAQQVSAEEWMAAQAVEEQQRLTEECQTIEAALVAATIALEGDILGTIRAEVRLLQQAKIARETLLDKQAALVVDRAHVQEEVATLQGQRVAREQQRSAVAAAGQKAQEEVERLWTRLLVAAETGGWAGRQKAVTTETEEAWLEGIASETQTAYDDAVASHTKLNAEAVALAAKLTRATEVRVRHAEAQREAHIAGELGQLLMANRFRSYLLEEAIRTLGEDGSRHLRELSGGRYSFHTEGADFLIVDGWNADERRSVKTLSGGETFLASLALALGLAEGLPALGPGEHGHQRLESLFIDEGFGTLDPDETLDIVTQALENLRTNDRIVGIVTHLPQLAERLPAQIRVVKSQLGSHIEVTSE